MHLAAGTTNIKATTILLAVSAALASLTMNLAVFCVLLTCCRGMNSNAASTWSEDSIKIHEILRKRLCPTSPNVASQNAVRFHKYKLTYVMYLKYGGHACQVQRKRKNVLQHIRSSTEMPHRSGYCWKYYWRLYRPPSYCDATTNNDTLPLHHCLLLEWYSNASKENLLNHFCWIRSRSTNLLQSQMILPTVLLSRGKLYTQFPK